MNSHKYSRLPTSDPCPEFNALDGPSYYSYEIERKKYGSAFSYSGASGPAEYSQPAGKTIGIIYSRDCGRIRCIVIYVCM